MAGSTSVSTGEGRQNCWNTTRIRRPRSSRRRCFNGPGSSRRSSGSIIPAHADQFNSIHERLIEAWKKLGAGRHLHLTGTTENPEDAGTLAYLEDTARQAGLATTLIDIEDIGLRDDGSFVDLDDRADRARVQALSLGMDVSRRIRRAARQGADALDRAAVEGHPFQQGHSSAAVGDVSGSPQSAAGLFRGRPERGQLGTSFVRKPLYSREGANVALVSDGMTLVEQEGPYGAEGFIRQALAPLPNFSGQYPVLGSWLVDHIAVRTVDPRGRKSDHRQYVAVPAARDPVAHRARKR